MDGNPIRTFFRLDFYDIQINDLFPNSWRESHTLFCKKIGVVGYMAIYGYVRVSTREQHTDRQVVALRDFGVNEKNMYMDKQSGKNFDRPQYRKLIKRIRSGDTFVIKSIDRLGRNYQEIIEQWRIITKEKKANIVVLDMPLLDTRQGRDLTGTLIADIVLQLLSYVAETERLFIRQRQSEGIAAAKEKGVRFGPKPLERSAAYYSCFEEYIQGKMSSRKTGEIIGIAHSTFLRWVKYDREKMKKMVQVVDYTDHSCATIHVSDLEDTQHRIEKTERSF